MVFFAGDPENMLIAAEVKGSGLGWGASSTTRCSKYTETFNIQNKLRRATKNCTEKLHRLRTDTSHNEDPISLKKQQSSHLIPSRFHVFDLTLCTIPTDKTLRRVTKNCTDKLHRPRTDTSHNEEPISSKPQQASHLLPSPFHIFALTLQLLLTNTADSFSQSYLHTPVLFKL